MKIKYKPKSFRYRQIRADECIPGTEVLFIGMSDQVARSVSLWDWEQFLKPDTIYTIHVYGLKKDHNPVAVYINHTVKKEGFYIPLTSIQIKEFISSPEKFKI